ncbi:MAG: hypothetical protein NXI20_06260 [bacterium]|nr:hypothetical protein [bacterium]
MTRKFLLFFNCFIVLIFMSCDDEEPSLPDAPGVTNVTVSDISDFGDGRDISIQFLGASDESSVSSYSIFVVAETNSSSFDLSSAQSTTGNAVTEVTSTGGSYTVELDQNTLDTDNQTIAEDVSYVIYIMSNGIEANNVLTGPSNSFTLTTQAINAPIVAGIEIWDVSNLGDARDFNITFNKVQDESFISEYRLFMVPASNAGDFDLDVADANDNYLSITPSGSNIDLNLDETSKDSNGDIIVDSTFYAAFVLTIADGTNADGSNSLSEQSRLLELLHINYDIYVSDAGNFSNPPWQIVKFDGRGERFEVFIKQELDWPQDIVFMDDGTVLISNLGSGRITKHDAETGDFIEDWANGIGGPTRVKVGPDGLFYVLQWQGNGKVLRYNTDGSFVDEFTESGVTSSIGLDWDSDGNLYVSSFSQSTITKFGPNGENLGVFIDDATGPTNIYFDDNGDLLVFNYSGTTVSRYDSDGNLKSQFLTGLSQCEGFDFLPNGDIIIGNGGTSSVKRFNSNGMAQDDLIESGAAELLNPNAVIVRYFE